MDSTSTSGRCRKNKKKEKGGENGEEERDEEEEEEEGGGRGWREREIYKEREVPYMAQAFPGTTRPTLLLEKDGSYK